MEKLYNYALSDTETTNEQERALKNTSIVTLYGLINSKEQLTADMEKVKDGKLTFSIQMEYGTPLDLILNELDICQIQMDKYNPEGIYNILLSGEFSIQEMNAVVK